MMIVDGAALHVYGFNYTKLDIEQSRSFGVITRDKKIVREAAQLFDADALRQNYTPTHPRLVVSPENSRARLTDFIKGARKELLIYDAQVSDNAIQKVLFERAKAGVEIRILGCLEKSNPDVKVRPMSTMRLHVRAIIRDGTTAFIGSQSLRKLELEGRREVGIIIQNAAVVRKIQSVFESDWQKNKKAAAGVVGYFFRARHHARVDDRAALGDGVEGQVVAVDLHQHEGLLGVVPGRGQRRSLAQVAVAQLTRRALHEILDPVLRLDPLVGVVVPAQHQADVVLHEQRLQRRLQLQLRAVASRPTNRARDGSRRSSISRSTSSARPRATSTAPGPCRCSRARRTGRPPSAP